MNYWLLKTEPSTFSWHDLQREGFTIWDGVRNYQARNNLKLMKRGDCVLIYHSVKDKMVVGIASVSKEYFKDPTSEDEWVAIEVIPVETLKSPVSLDEIKNNKWLSNIALIKQSRLSVLPLSDMEYNEIIKMSNM